MNSKIGNGSIPLRIGNLINTQVYGGPYRTVPVDFWGVKMAEEIEHPHMVSVPTRDFCVPEVSDMRRGVVKALMAMINDELVYVGCMGGIGRTGLFLGVLAKVQIDYRKSKHRKGRGDDPVAYVREHFLSHAIETDEQQKFVRTFDTTDIVAWLDATQTAMGLGGLTPPKDALAYTGKCQAIYEPHEEIPPDLLDHEIVNPALPLSAMAEQVEQDLEWVEQFDADSAVEHDELTVSDQVNDMWQYLDEHDDRVDALESRISTLEKSLSEGLTKPSIFERLRMLFK